MCSLHCWGKDSRRPEPRVKRLCWLLCRYRWADKETLEEYFCWMTLKLKYIVLILFLNNKDKIYDSDVDKVDLIELKAKKMILQEFNSKCFREFCVPWHKPSRITYENSLLLANTMQVRICYPCYHKNEKSKLMVCERYLHYHIKKKPTL